MKQKHIERAARKGFLAGRAAQSSWRDLPPGKVIQPKVPTTLVGRMADKFVSLFRGKPTVVEAAGLVPPKNPFKKPALAAAYRRGFVTAQTSF